MFGKSAAAFAGDQFVPTPASTVVYMNDGTQVVIDSMQASFNNVGNLFEYVDPTMGIDMMLPLEYDFTATGAPYSFKAYLPKTVTTALPYYIRQDSDLEITDAAGNVESAHLVNEQILFKPFFKNLGLPVNP